MTTQDQHTWRDSAAKYLLDVLAERAPAAITFEAEFSEAPLEGEGRTALFAFELEVATTPPGATAVTVAGQPTCPGRQQMKHYVAVGETMPNYFPAYDFAPDDAYSLHVGTRFMLEMGLQKLANDMAPPDAESRLQLVINNFLANAQFTPPELVAVFGCDDATYSVYRLTVNAEPYYLMGGDCPPGFYALTHFPPQIALRLHLGKLIRNEAQSNPK